MHPLLEQQLRQHFGWPSPGEPDAERWGGAAWADFIEAVDAAYTDADARRAMLERALAASSQELMSADNELRTTLTTANLLKRQLQARAAEVEGILAGTPHPILVTDEEGTILRASPAVETLFGWHPDELTGNSIAVILPSGRDYWTIRARRESAYSRLRASGGDVVPLTMEFVAVRRDGTELAVEATLADLHDPDGGYRVVAELADLTERRQAEAQARVLQKSEALGTLIAGVAHDFNNILTIISGSLAAADKDSPDHDRWTEIGQRSTDRAIALVASLLRFARRSPGTMAPFDLSSTGHDVVRMLHETLERRITLEAGAIESDLPLVTGDQNELQQVLMNLVLNARDAVLERADEPDSDLQPTIEIRVERAIKHGLPAVQVEVRDNGSGIPAANLERVFDPFFTTKPVGKGTGLGLSMAHSIIQNHGGEISIDSQVGVGTTIRFWLPTEVDADFVAASLPPAAPRVGTAMPPPGSEEWRVLVVDDEPHLLDLARFVFAPTGASVTTAQDALTALACVEAATFDAALVDVNMPGMDGWQLLERLREIAPELPVVIVSGYLDALDLRNHRPAAALSKPYEAQMLIETVRRVIESPPPSE